jgi:hypothetical protein
MTNKNCDDCENCRQFERCFPKVKNKLIEIPEANPYPDISGLTEEEVTQDE